MNLTNMPPRFAFLTPVYKTAFLAEALSSIRNQSFKDFTVVISDDCSPEDVPSVVAPFLADSRFSYRRNRVNIGSEGLVDHWNSLLAKCDSEFVIVASDDDVYSPEFLSSINKAIVLYPEANLFRVGTSMIDNTGMIIRAEHHENGIMTSVSYIDYLMGPDNVLCIGNCVFRTDALKKKGGFVRFPCGWKSDTATQLMLSLNGVVFAGDGLFSFRMSGMNISSGHPSDRRSSSLKLAGLLSFDEWFQSFLGQMAFDNDRLRITRAVRHRLEGESRSYFNSLSFGGFCNLFWRFVRDGWFLSARNMLSFVVSWFRRPR